MIRKKDGSATSEAQRVKRLGGVTAASVALAVAAAGFGAYSAFDANARIEGASAGMTAVLTAAAPIEKGSVVEASDLRVASVPASALVEGALGEDSAGAVEGRTATAAIARGAQITPGAVAGEGNASSLADALEPGSEAVTVSVDAQTGLAGLLKVGDTVRVVSVLGSMGGAGAASDVSAGARVVALDGVLDGGGDYASVTLQVEPDEATAIRAAQAAGTVSLVLASSVG